MTLRLSEQLNIESIELVNENTKLDEIGVDSLGLVDLVILIEEDFNVKFPTNTDLSELITIKDVANLVYNKIK